MLQKIRNRFALLRDEEGLSTVEYIIILGLIAIAGIQAWTTFGDTLETEVGDATNQMNVVN